MKYERFIANRLLNFGLTRSDRYKLSFRWLRNDVLFLEEFLSAL